MGVLLGLVKQGVQFNDSIQHSARWVLVIATIVVTYHKPQVRQVWGASIDSRKDRERNALTPFLNG